MKIYEHQAKALFARYAIPVPKGHVAFDPEGAEIAARSIGRLPVVLKAQVHAGGRGKAGGVRVVGDIGAVRAEAASLLGKKLVTAQTGPAGALVGALLVEEAIRPIAELYLGITIDRSARRCVMLAAAQGGVEVESLPPSALAAERIDPAFGLRPFQARRLFFALRLAPSVVSSCEAVATRLFRLFAENDCSAAEINPLVLTEGGLVAADAKVVIDDNALFRHPDLAALRDESDEDPLELRARKLGLNYIKLPGNVGCMVNGAGLAMATMDLIKLAGAEPANFLDVGGGATSEMISEGLTILMSDPDVRVLFINIFGGILRCDTLARGFVDAASKTAINVPVVVRLEGTNREEGERMLASCGLDLIRVGGMAEAASAIRGLLSR